MKKLSNHAVIPRKGSKEAAGYDLYSASQIVVPPQGCALVPTDLSLRVPLGTYGRIAPRSGLALKHHLDVGGGVIDRDYTGPVGIILYNHDKKEYVVKEGEKIAQLICEKIEHPILFEVDELKETLRGDHGFGSTDRCN